MKRRVRGITSGKPGMNWSWFKNKTFVRPEEMDKLGRDGIEIFLLRGRNKCGSEGFLMLRAGVRSCFKLRHYIRTVDLAPQGD
jgi:hypothetical protein